MEILRVKPILISLFKCYNKHRYCGGGIGRRIHEATHL